MVWKNTHYFFLSEFHVVKQNKAKRAVSSPALFLNQSLCVYLMNVPGSSLPKRAEHLSEESLPGFSIGQA